MSHLAGTILPGVALPSAWLEAGAIRSVGSRGQLRQWTGRHACWPYKDRPDPPTRMVGERVRCVRHGLGRYFRGFPVQETPGGFAPTPLRINRLL